MASAISLLATWALLLFFFMGEEGRGVVSDMKAFLRQERNEVGCFDIFELEL